METNLARHLVLIAIAVFFTVVPRPVDAGIVLTADAPGVQASTVAGVTTETFNGFSTGNYATLTTAVGTLSTSGGFAIVAADSWGGAGGSGNYFALGAQSGSADPVTLTLSGPETYFGMWWSAADGNNEVKFYNNGVLLATYSTSTAFNGLGGSYYGNPNNGQDSGEEFAYLNFTATPGTSFNEVVFSNSGTTGTGFESDNWSVSNSAMVAEPPSSVLAGLGLAVGLLALWRRLNRAKACPH